MIKKGQWDIFFKDLEAGLTITDSALDAGFERVRVYQIMREKNAFKQKVESAILKSKKSCIGTVLKAKKKNWVAAAWWLERKFPDEFALKGRLEHSIEKGTLRDLLMAEKKKSAAEGKKD